MRMTAIEVIVILIIFGLLGVIAAMAWYDSANPCIESHLETQYQSPPSVMAGGGKYGGGIAIPIGNIKPVQVEVCDKR